MKITDFGVAIIEHDTHLSKWIVEHGRLDMNEGFLSLFRKHIPEGGVVFDVGASLGDHTATYSKFVGPSGEVHAFEPNPPTFECLLHNMKHYKNVICHKYALGSRDSSCGIVEDENIGKAMISGSGSIPVLPMDSCFYDLKRLDFVKIDAEGYEPHILDGGIHTFAKHRPAILMEVNRPVLELQGFTVDDVYCRLHAMGYNYRPCEPHLSLEMDMVDVLCIHESAG